MRISYDYAAYCAREDERPMCKLCSPWPPADRANVLTPRQRAKLYKTS